MWPGFCLVGSSFFVLLHLLVQTGMGCAGRKEARLKKCCNSPLPFCNGGGANSQSLCSASKHLRADGCCRFTLHHLQRVFICAVQPLPPISTDGFGSHFHINFAVLAPKSRDAFGCSLRGAGRCRWRGGTASPGTGGGTGAAEVRVCSGSKGLQVRQEML